MVVAWIRLFFPMLFVLCRTITIIVTGIITHHRYRRIGASYCAAATGSRHSIAGKSLSQAVSVPSVAIAKMAMPIGN